MADRMPTGGDDVAGLTAFDPKASAGLFVGVSRFEDTRILVVPYAVDDAVDLAHLFTLELGLVRPERAVLLLAGEPCKAASRERLARLIEKGAKQANARQHDIYRQLEELTQSTGDRGLFVLSVATHGVSDQGGDFFVATDSVKGRTLRSGIAVAEVLDEVARADADSGGMGRRLVLLDACRERLTEGTRGGSDSAMAKSFADAIGRSKGVAILSGSTLGGFAYDDPDRENGVFTAAVLDGLRGEAQASPEGWITVRTLADFVQQRVAAWVRRRRPDHAAKSLGIGRQIEATAESLPLAPHPMAMEEQQRYRLRREAALLRVKENQGRVLPGALWDQVVALLPDERQSGSDVERLLEEIEALDGRERSQRSLRDFLREVTGSAGSSVLPSPLDSKEELATTSGERRRPEALPATAKLSERTAKPLANVSELILLARRRVWKKAGWAAAVALVLGALISFVSPWELTFDRGGSLGREAAAPPSVEPKAPSTGKAVTAPPGVSSSVKPQRGKVIVADPLPSSSAIKPLSENEGTHREVMPRAEPKPRNQRGPRPEGIPGLMIAEIELTGIFATKKGYVAQVKATNQNKSYLLREGDQLYDGNVVTIRRSEIRFNQIVANPTGLKPFREVVMSLGPE